MPPLVHSCWWMDDQAEAAAEHYVSVFPRSQVQTVTRYGAGGRMAEGLALTVTLSLDGAPLTLLNGGPAFRHTPAASLVISVQTQEEIDHYLSALSAVPEAEQCGWLQDRWGVHWQIVPQPLMTRLQGPDHPGRQRMMAALMQMRRLDLAALLAAHDSRA